MKQLQDFALAGRNSYYMLGIMPGVVSRYGNFSTDFRGTSFSMGGLQINGQRKDTNFITVDGISNTNTKDGVTQNNIVGVDFIEELKVATSHYAAEYGRTTGAQIAYTTRRGTQSYHMSAFEFFLSEAFAGQQFVTGGRPHLRYHDFGATLGGPAYIPGKWNADKSKLFFFVGFEARKTPGFTQKFINVPTVLEKGGDFNASAIKPIDPSTGAPFPGNVIPTSRISAYGRYIAKVYPNPNYVGPGGNFYNAGSQPTDAMDQIYRVDYNIKPTWQLSFRFMPGSQETTSNYSFNPFPLFEAVQTRRGDSSMVSLTTSLNPTTVNEFAVGYSAYRETLDTRGDGAFRSTYGLSFPSLYTINHPTRIPVTIISGYQTTTGGGYSKQATPTFTLRENFSKVLGAHVIKAGVYFEQMSYNQLNTASDNGAFQFGSSAQNPKNSRNPLANAMLGNADAYQEGGPLSKPSIRATTANSTSRIPGASPPDSPPSSASATLSSHPGPPSGIIPSPSCPNIGTPPRRPSSPPTASSSPAPATPTTAWSCPAPASPIPPMAVSPNTPMPPSRPSSAASQPATTRCAKPTSNPASASPGTSSATASSPSAPAPASSRASLPSTTPAGPSEPALRSPSTPPCSTPPPITPAPASPTIRKLPSTPALSPPITKSPPSTTTASASKLCCPTKPPSTSATSATPAATSPGPARSTSSPQPSSLRTPASICGPSCPIAASTASASSSPPPPPATTRSRSPPPAAPATSPTTSPTPSAKSSATAMRASPAASRIRSTSAQIAPSSKRAAATTSSSATPTLSPGSRNRKVSSAASPADGTSPDSG
ncbi:MAG: hypothetical protein IPP47_17770 [Bryobacterales bacterium]|nr:hypothetical protein [Bryobacterales bacterium]